MDLLKKVIGRPETEIVKRRKIFGVLVASILLLTVGFGALSATLTISGTASVIGNNSVHFSSYTQNSSTADIANEGYAAATVPAINQTTTKINNYSIILYEPGDSVEYKFKIVNSGNKNSEISNISIGTGTYDGEDIEYVVLVQSHVSISLKYVGGAKDGQDLAVGDLIAAGEEQVVSLKYTLTNFEYNDESSAVTISGLQAKILYIESLQTTTTTTTSNVGNNQGNNLVPTDASCFTFTSGTGTITAYDATCGSDVVIPSQINSVNVVKIGQNSFKNKQLTSVIFEDTQAHQSELTTISSAAFNSNDLIEVVIPSSVTTIGDTAFYLNPDIERIIIKRDEEDAEANMTLGNDWSGYATVIYNPNYGE